MSLQDSPTLEHAADDARTREHFEALAAAHGGDVRALDWGSRASQEQRFAVLASIGDLDGARVLDVGCGQADFHAWLLARDIRCDYTGLDLSPAMIAHCRARFPDQTFEVCNILEQDPPAENYDFVFASGIFYLRRHEPERYLRAMIERMFALCRRGMAFNSLSSWNEPDAGSDEYHADPSHALSIAARLTPKLILRHDYHPGDFTLLLHRERAP